tara:strand:+ start:681 stop:971 length:291 start_codon:yes stop_codon:yes gene_type:complete
MIRNEILDPESVVLDGLGSAVLGISDRSTIVYSYDRMLEHFKKKGMTHRDALDWVDYNVLPLTNCGAGFTICYESNSIERIDTLTQPVDSIDTERN